MGSGQKKNQIKKKSGHKFHVDLKDEKNQWVGEKRDNKYWRTILNLVAKSTREYKMPHHANKATYHKHIWAFLGGKNTIVVGEKNTCSTNGVH